MGIDKDIEEKFKKDVSKEIANLKEFLIQQGKEIVKIKQENKSLKEIQKSDGSGGIVGLTPELKQILDKQQHSLEKQKENTTKLSKLCLGTLTELEKLEKQQQEKGTDGRNEEKIKRLTEENKKLIHLVTALDQQVAVLETRIEKNAPSRPGSRLDTPSGGLTKDEVNRMIREAVMQVTQDNNERDGQINSLITELQNLIGQHRGLDAEVKDLVAKINRLERNDTNERFGLQLAEALSRVEKIEGQHVKSQQNNTGGLDDVFRRLEGVQDDLGQVRQATNRARGQIDELETFKGRVEDISLEMDKLKSKMDSGQTANLGKVENLSQSVLATKTEIESVKLSLEALKRETDDMQSSRTTSTTVRSEEMTKLRDSNSQIEERLTGLQKAIDLGKVEHKATSQKITGDLELLTEKFKTLSVSFKDEKHLTEEKLAVLDKLVTDQSKNAVLSSEFEARIKDIKSANSSIDQAVKSMGTQVKALQTEVTGLSGDAKVTKAASDKATKSLEDLNTKIFDCMHDYESLNDKLDQLSKKVDRRPAKEELDKKSELTNKLYNDLSAKIDDVESAVKQEAKKNKAEMEKANNALQNKIAQSEEASKASTKDLATLKTEVNQLSAAIGDLKNTPADVKKLAASNEEFTKSITTLKVGIEEAKIATKTIGEINSNLRQTKDKMKTLEDDISAIRKEKSGDKMTGLEKDLVSLRADHEKVNKDLKALSTEVKYIDSTIKKEAANTKTELTGFTKTIKGFEKDLDTIHKMVDVLNDQSKESNVGNDLNKIRDEMKQIKTETSNCDTKVGRLKDELNEKVKTEMKEATNKINQTKDELGGKISTLTSDLKTLEKKVSEQALSKAAPDDKEIQNKIKKSQEEISKSVEKCKEDLTSKIQQTETKVQKIKDDLSAKITAEMKSTETKISKLETSVKALPEIQTKLAKSDGVSCDSLKKEMDKINNEIKESLKKWEGKLTSQETQVGLVKTTVKDIADKVGKLDKTDKADDVSKKELDKLSTKIQDSQKSMEDKLNKSIKDVTDKLAKIESSSTSNKTGDSSKKEIEKINQLVKDSQKAVEDKINQQVKSLKEVSDKIGKLEKSDSGTKTGSESAKLTTLSKAIDSIQENSKSLETMVKKMKTEFSTPKDLDKLKNELLSKVSGGGPGEKALDTPDMAPIMESLIMTNDRPYIDCCTLTPITGNGLVKFERMNAMNKLPWDDVNDQFVIQEPGVYVVFLTAVLQDALLSVKIASNMLEREVCTIGSRDGLVGVSAPAYVARMALFQIEDDDNVCETIIVEINADNEESFVDKSVSLTLFKIAEAPGGD